jgi:hypothetical protein
LSELLADNTNQPAPQLTRTADLSTPNSSGSGSVYSTGSGRKISTQSSLDTVIGRLTQTQTPDEPTTQQYRPSLGDIFDTEISSHRSEQVCA